MGLTWVNSPRVCIPRPVCNIRADRASGFPAETREKAQPNEKWAGQQFSVEPVPPG
eukprot:CAMPEP_0174351088 /NCGR_PEP_ID=MMETSP0811_2-20130205/8323_1 /TAXON_ID=73025 ORGANISM="Eutreptiella gymnastica-like, Strain CCMP1594" /NCGR_SAMPLE_ID=MMETSP0811_2 /ASSEMBLY_ACC=CAM_ASM_000667 /LENGTH=55 /DNA_ID=CAMNT_0015479965 /DNA_START=1417 /DNA_END=1581 /DNA_ORIENTATION=-